jgi:hypothetical protein
MAAASDGLASKECGSAAGSVMIEDTLAWSPAMALATLPQTLVEATTVGVVAAPAPSDFLSLPHALSPTDSTSAETATTVPTRTTTPRNTNENRFQ